MFTATHIGRFGLTKKGDETAEAQIYRKWMLRRHATPVSTAAMEEGEPN